MTIAILISVDTVPVYTIINSNTAETIGKTKVNSTTPYCWHQEANQQNHLFYVDELLHIELVLKFMVQKYFGLGVPVKKNHV